ncbi:glycosyltransferase [Acinetobacter courvalinii]|uniref:glycosyltransferase n=1 Tax=Acinetobacter courvalinii TaxID=280147 RepID=UPI0019012BED|nr:glycosyltransferase [Acinetobacter courvalinii]MBJ8419817.1 hypothetical protein [Acinetobacter courvalinii]
MKKSEKIIYLANAGSPHVRHWIEYLDEMNISYHIYSVHKNTFFPESKVTVKYSFLSKLGGFGIILAYIFLGIWLRFYMKKSFLLHAHNTSGYGLSALLSGNEYIVTTYGTEIFGAKNRSSLYNFIINNTLKRAKKITATSIAMEKTLLLDFNIDKSKIQTFGFGVSSKFKFSLNMRRKIRSQLGISENSIIWVYNRRITPLYNTLETVNAFKKFSKGKMSKHLILMEGDKDIEYTKLVTEVVKEEKNIHLVKGFLDQSNMSAYLSAADIAISLPNSDQLSSSILESISCGCLPMLANLPTYQPIFETMTSIHVNFNNIESSFYESNDLIIKLGGEARSKIILEYAKTEWGRDKTIFQINKVYNFR